MQGTQEEIQAIQARLQAISAREKSYRPATAAQMVEMFPASRPTSVPGASAPQAATTTGLTQEQPTLQWPSSIPTPPFKPSTLGVPDRSTSPVTERAALTQIDETWQQLTAKAEHINQLASAQENALLELRAIAQRLERDWRATGLEQFPYADNTGDFSPLYRQSSATLTCVERDDDGNFLLASRTLDLLKAEREALQMAQVLRKKRRHQSTDFLTPVGGIILGWLKSLFSGFSRHPSRNGRRVASATATTAPEGSGTISLPIAVLWLMGSTVARMAIDIVLASHPGLYLPAVLLIAAPAAIAMYRTTVAPETSIEWGYRLLLIMVGLLLGGRF
ncbi:MULTISPECIES: hypothetical protein [unclassified Leptolyngbya]|uniref:hypothetical protein n=1 Tax=unclassified Leptolyngbya TaxID=2650499 RepID=UPI00168669E3|nr:MULTISPECIES: hypothetical protein [unclassified Leptolyngbya]MBD1909550.1 hypothetical protein [Leptolyngbya sp. FACHB-8]MBD2154088.1 hypothetical protein [Leptolyngbya sp. FACHB-16]